MIETIKSYFDTVSGTNHNTIISSFMSLRRMVKGFITSVVIILITYRTHIQNHREKRKKNTTLATQKW
jgi:hypothetical protein